MDLTIFQTIDYRTLLVMGGFLGLLVLFFFAHKKQQQRIGSGKELIRSEGQNQNNLFVINLSFRVTRPGRWYRVSADFDFATKEKEGFAIPKKRILHPYELSLRNQAGRILVDDAGTFHDFVGFSGSSKRQFSYITGGRSSSHHHGKGVPLLEFVPPRSGQYSVSFKVPVEETINAGTFRYKSWFTQFALLVKENVLPMKARAYPHKKIDLRSAVGGRTRENN